MLLGEHSIANFLAHMQQEMGALHQLHWKNYASPEKPQQDQNAKCYACEKAILGSKYMWGICGVYPDKCRKAFQFKLPYVPIIFHNLSRYDIHLRIAQLGPHLSLIPCNKELYISNH